MQHADNQNLRWKAEIEHNMFAVLKSSQSNVERIASAPKSGVIGQNLKAVPKTLNVMSCLSKAPSLHRIANDGFEIRFSKSC